MNPLKKRITLFPQPLHLFNIISVSILFATANLILSFLNTKIFHSPLFLDSIFTAAGAVLLGPAGGVTVGLLTNIFMEPLYGMTGYYWPFAICNMSTGLIIGFMKDRRLLDQLLHLPWILLLVTITNSILGALIGLLLFRGYSGGPIDRIIMVFEDLDQSLSSAVFWTGFTLNFVDKAIVIVIVYIMNQRISRPKSWKSYNSIP